MREIAKNLWVFGVVLGLSAAVSCKQQEKTEVVSTNDKENPILAQCGEAVVRQSDFKVWMASRGGSVAQVGRATPDQRRGILSQILSQKVMESLAKKAGVDQSPQYHQAIETAKTNQLILLFAQTVTVTDQEVLRYYKANKDKLTTDMRISHLAVSSDEEAKKVQALLRKGATVDGLQEEKIPPAALGYSAVDPKLVLAAKSLSPGQTTIVKTMRGLEVLRVEKPAVRTQTYDSIKEQLRSALRSEKVQALYKEYTSKHPTQIHESRLAPLSH